MNLTPTKLNVLQCALQGDLCITLMLYLYQHFEFLPGLTRERRSEAQIQGISTIFQGYSGGMMGINFVRSHVCKLSFNLSGKSYLQLRDVT